MGDTPSITILPMGRAQAEVIRLGALGYDPKIKDGRLDTAGKTGGLVKGGATGEVVIPPGSLLLRLFSWSGDFGPWWFTPYELLRVLRHFDRSIDVLLEGREDGKSGFHAAFGLMREWYVSDNRNPTGKQDQISRFHAVKTLVPVPAWYGVGDEAYWLGTFDNNGTMTEPPRTQAPIALSGGAPARQLYLPNAKHYRHCFEPLPRSGSPTELIRRVVKKYKYQRLPFE